MVLANINDFSNYQSLNPHFKTLIDYLSGHNLLSEDLGKIVVDGDNVYINNIKAEGMSADSQVLEMHKKYIDVHILLEGRETIGIKALAKISTFSKAYDEISECMLSQEKADCYIEMMPGDIMICFPEDAHAPAIGNGVIRKAIAKVIL